jgi:hypothetical protein
MFDSELIDGHMAKAALRRRFFYPFRIGTRHFNASNDMPEITKARGECPRRLSGTAQ